nr:epididymal protein 13 [Ovis aries]
MTPRANPHVLKRIYGEVTEHLLLGHTNGKKRSVCQPLVSWAQSRHLSASRRLEGVCGQLASPLESGRTVSDQSPVGPGRSSSTPTPKPTVHKSGPSLKMFLLILLFLGLADACIPREVATEEKIKLLKGIVGMMSRLSADGVRLSDSSSKTPSLAPQQDRTEEEIKILKQILGLLSLQVLNEESSGCKEEVKLLPTATTPKKPLKKKTGWNGLRCAYMMVTFLFVSYNKGDWCYCHYCNPDVDNRNNPCCAF